LQAFHEICPGDFPRAESYQMLRRYLAVDEFKAFIREIGGVNGKRNLGRVGLFREHGFPEECPAYLNVIQAARDFIAVPRLDRVGISGFMQPDIRLDHVFCYPSTGILKRYALDKIKDLKLLKTGFKSMPKNLDAVLQESANIWFAEKATLEVEVLIDAQAGNYFKRRKMFPTQQIREERPDGSLVVTFQVGHEEAIRNLLKSWIPHVSILGPPDFRKQFVQEVKAWAEKQKQ